MPLRFTFFGIPALVHLAVNIQLATLITVLLTLTSNRLLARVGETYEECQARYGKPVAPLDTLKDGLKGMENGMAVFRKSGLDIAIQFYEGKADCINFTRYGKYNLAEKLSDTEIAELMRANAGDRAWTQYESQDATYRCWKTENESLLANYGIFTRSLTLVTPAAAKRHDAEKAAKEKAKLKDF